MMMMMILYDVIRSEGTVHIAHVSDKGEMEYHEASTAELMPGDLIVVTVQYECISSAPHPMNL